MIFPSANRLAGEPGSLRCKYPGCDKTFTPRAGLEGKRIRTYFYNTVRLHENDCSHAPICPIAAEEGVVSSRASEDGSLADD